MQRNPPQYSDEYAKVCTYRELGNPYMADVYDFDMVESDLLNRGWRKKCCMLAMVDCMPWIILGSNAIVIRSCMVMYV